ncbi:MAG: NADPH-dependent F420 reductase [Thermoproteota archaeon]|jgi:NADPH-dependent F420 reductase
MKIALLGGTGDLGTGLAIRWGRYHEVIVGSRFEEKAKADAQEYALKAASSYLEEVKGKIIGMKNEDAVKYADVIVICIPAIYINDTLNSIKNNFDPNKLVISPVVPLRKANRHFVYDPSIVTKNAKSAAEAIANILKAENIVSALHTIPANKLADPYSRLNYDVPFCASNENSKNLFVQLAKDLSPHLNCLHVGGIELSSLIESITVTIINISINTRKWNLAIKFVE